MAEELLTSTLKGLRDTSKGRLKTEFVFEGKTNEEQLSILEQATALPPWSPQIEIWLQKKPIVENQDPEPTDMDNLETELAEMSNASLEDEFFEMNLSVDEQISKEIEDKGRNLDDKMWHENMNHMEEVMSALNIQRQEKEEKPISKQKKMDDQQDISRQNLERNQMLEKHLLLEAQDVRKKYLEEYKTENELRKARIQSGEQESKRIQLEKLEKRRHQLYQDHMEGIRMFRIQVLNPAVREANATGAHLQKVKLEEAILKQERMEQQRLKKEKLEKELLEKKHLEQQKASRQKEKVTSTSTQLGSAVQSSTSDDDEKGSDKKSQARLQSKMSIPESVIEYTVMNQKLAEVSYRNTLSTATDAATKQYRFQLKKTIGLIVNALSSNNGEILIDKITTAKELLKGTLMGRKLPTMNHSVYCSNLLAMKLVKQGEDEVSNNLAAAFPLAAFIISLSTHFANVGELILAHLHLKCPVLVPMYCKEKCGISKVESLKLQGYKIYGGNLETEEMYLRRMCGMIRLYAAVISSPQLPIEHASHPHGPSNGWAWLARMMNMDPSPTITAMALGSFLVAGHTLFKVYGKQFKKLLNILYKEYMPKIKKITPTSQRGPYQRLAQFLDTCVKTGRFPEPKGFLQKQFWLTRNKGVSYA